MNSGPHVLFALKRNEQQMVFARERELDPIATRYLPGRSPQSCGRIAVRGPGPERCVQRNACSCWGEQVYASLEPLQDKDLRFGQFVARRKAARAQHFD